MVTSRASSILHPRPIAILLHAYRSLSYRFGLRLHEFSCYFRSVISRRVSQTRVRRLSHATIFQTRPFLPVCLVPAKLSFYSFPGGSHAGPLSFAPFRSCARSSKPTSRFVSGTFPHCTQEPVPLVVVQLPPVWTTGKAIGCVYNIERVSQLFRRSFYHAVHSRLSPVW